MSKAQDFVVEIGTEELPPHELSRLATSFAESLEHQLKTAEINFAAVTSYATPRRLAVFIKDLASSQPQQSISKRGPAVSSAYNKDGTPTQAAIGFANSCGVPLQQITTMQNEKGIECLYFADTAPGSKTIDLLPNMVSHALQQLPIKKAMRWGMGEIAFIRPIHWVLMLYGKSVINANIFGIQSDNLTFGHRIHAPKPLRISSANQYAAKLEKDGKIIIDFNKRKEYIRQQILALAAQTQATAVIDETLLNMVTGLVEHPVALLASFATEFLRVPKECLISAMQDHQKCFALIDQQQKLLPKFIVISNLTSTSPATVIRGNELVMSARLADAAFHFDSDLKIKLSDRVDALKHIIYQQQLGSIYDKTTRIANFGKHFALRLNCDPALIQRAAYLCKADLVTNMVYEFPELQGIMGYYYALHDHEPEAVAIAIREHYQPRNAQDQLPVSQSGIMLAVADRVDSLVGLFGIGKAPTGEKDPFGLRRQALAVLRILIDKAIDWDLRELFAFAAKEYGDRIKDPVPQLLDFCAERLKAWYLAENVPAKVLAAVMANNPTSPLDFHRRVQAVLRFQSLPAAENLAAANKRVQNILQKTPDLTAAKVAQIDQKLLQEPAEKQLFTILQAKEQTIKPLLKSANYTEILQTLAELQTPINDFFDHVMVNVDNQSLRQNRLQILHNLRSLFLQVADISLL